MTIKPPGFLPALDLGSISSLAVALALSQSLSAQDFSAGLMIPTPVHPNAVATGDFNEDGIPDLAIPCWSPNLLTIVLGDGQGGGATPVSYSLGGGVGPRFVLVADFNSDGHDDVATPNSESDDVSILLGNGTGSLSFARRIPVGLVPHHAAAGDLNADGLLDIVVANSGSGSISVLLGTGSAQFASASAYGVGTDPRGVCLGDFNGDGSLDVAVSNFGSHTITRLLGTGSGSFGTGSHFAVGSNPYKLAAGDFNGDGLTDLAIPNYGAESVSILLADAATGFAIVAPLMVGTSPRTVISVDLDGDNIPDLVVANYADNTVSLFKGNGLGGFAPSALRGVGSGPFSMCAVDLNLDGALDLAVADRDGHTVSLVTGMGNLHFDAPTIAAVGRNPRGVAAEDVNGDGLIDLAIPNYSDGNVSVMLGTGAGGFVPAVQYAVRAGPTGASIADVNGDHLLDMVVANSSNNSVSVLLGNGQGGFASGVKWSVGSGPRSTVIADFNLDGIPDIAAPLFGAGAVSILRGTGGASFATAVSYPTGAGSVALATADLNQDGRPDLVAANTTAANISVLLANASGTFFPAVSFPCGNTPSAIALHDFDLDGHLDVVVANENANTVSFLRGLGGGVFGVAASYPTGARPLGLTVGDVTGDSLPDLVVAAATAERVIIHPGMGNGTFASPVFLPAGDFSRALALADLNGDTQLDIVVANANGNDVWVLLNRDGALADLAVAVDNGVSVLTRGAAASYAVTVSNLGPASVTSVALNLGIPASLESVTLTPSAGAFDAGSGIWSGLTLDAGASATLTVAGTVSLSASGSLSLAAEVQLPAGVVDPAPGNNSALDSDTILLGDADLAVAISNELTAANAGDPLTYTVAVGNVGPVDVGLAAVDVVLPSQLLGVSWTSSVTGGATAPASGTGDFAGTVDLPVGGMAVFTFLGTVDPASATGTLIATATVQTPGDVIDPQPANNLAADVDDLTGNAPPVAVPQSVTLDEDGQIAVALSGTDADGDPLTFSIVQGPGHGLLSGTLPALTYTPAANFAGNDTFVFSVSDGTHSGTATVSLVVNPVNDDPVANAFSVTTDEDIALSLALSGSDLDGDSLSFVILTPPALGTLTGSAPSLSFVPTANVSGSDSFTYAVTDGTVQSAPATVTIEIAAVNDVPTVILPVVDQTVNGEDTSLVLDLTGRFADVETPAASLTLSVVSGNPSLVSPSLAGTQLALQLAPGMSGTATVTVRATDPGGAFVEDAFTVTVVRPGVHLSVSDASATEGSSAGVVFTLTLSAPSDQPVSVNYATANGDAIAGSDYTAAQGTVTFAAGITTRTVKIVTTGDVLDEANETFQFLLSGGSGVVIDDGIGIGTIVDNDTSSLAVQNVSITEGNAGVAIATFTVTLSTPNAQDVTVSYATANISAGATAGIDYAATSGTLVFPAGSNASQIVTVDIVGDLIDETNEGFDFALSNPVNAGFSRQTARATIVDDDAPPVVGIADASVVEGNSGIKSLILTLSLSGPSQLRTRVRYQTADNSAVAELDYRSESGEVVFEAGVVSRTINVVIAGDALVEPDEAFFVNLHTPTSLTIGDGQAVGTITNDDLAP